MYIHAHRHTHIDKNVSARSKGKDLDVSRGDRVQSSVSESVEADNVFTGQSDCGNNVRVHVHACTPYKIYTEKRGRDDAVLIRVRDIQYSFSVRSIACYVHLQSYR